MRRIEVLILRLLFDPDFPQLLRGSIAPASGGEARHFANAESLLDLLEDMTRLPQGKTPPPDNRTNEKNGFKEAT